MKITDGDDLYIEISSARVLLSILTGSLGEISGHYDEHGWFIPNDDTQNLNHFFYSFEKWMELVRVIFDKLDEAYSYLHHRRQPITAGTGRCGYYTMAAARNQGEK